MGLIDFILNVAGLLLWFSWRSSRIDPLARTTPTALVGTLRRAEPSRPQRWHSLASLVALVLLRAVFYWQIGSAMNWTPRLDFAVVALAFPFRGDAFFPVLLYSVVSFAQALAIFYFWLLVLAMINRGTTSPNPIHKVVLLQLGRPGRWPLVVQLLLPELTLAILWIVFHPLLLRAGVTSRSQSLGHLAEQGLIVGFAVYFSLKYLLPCLLLAHLVASYIFLGENPIWDFIGVTARNILAPLARLPLRYARFDFAPLVGIVLILLLLHVLPTFAQYLLNRSNVVIWPD